MSQKLIIGSYIHSKAQLYTKESVLTLSDIRNYINDCQNQQTILAGLMTKIKSQVFEGNLPIKEIIDYIQFELSHQKPIEQIISEIKPLSEKGFNKFEIYLIIAKCKTEKTNFNTQKTNILIQSDDICTSLQTIQSSILNSLPKNSAKQSIDIYNEYRDLFTGNLQIHSISAIIRKILIDRNEQDYGLMIVDSPDFAREPGNKDQIQNKVNDIGLACLAIILSISMLFWFLKIKDGFKSREIFQQFPVLEQVENNLPFANHNQIAEFKNARAEVIEALKTMEKKHNLKKDVKWFEIISVFEDSGEIKVLITVDSNFLESQTGQRILINSNDGWEGGFRRIKPKNSNHFDQYLYTKKSGELRARPLELAIENSQEKRVKDKFSGLIGSLCEKYKIPPNEFIIANSYKLENEFYFYISINPKYLESGGKKTELSIELEKRGFKSHFKDEKGQVYFEFKIPTGVLS